MELLKRDVMSKEMYMKIAISIFKKTRKDKLSVDYTMYKLIADYNISFLMYDYVFGELVQIQQAIIRG